MRRPRKAIACASIVWILWIDFKRAYTRCTLEAGRRIAVEGIWKLSLWSEFGAAIDMLEDALHACPDDLWSEPRPSAGHDWMFWYTAYHVLFWLDLYLSGTAEGFVPPAPFTLDELDPSGVLPPRTYTKDELLAYVRHCRAKCRSTIEGLTEESASRRCTFPWGELTFAELLLDNMRHVQSHVAELDLMIGQRTGSGPRWRGKVRSG